MIRRNQDTPAGQALVGGFSFALLAGLAILSLLIVVMGAKVYRTIDEASAQNSQSRTVLSYIAGKVRATDAADSIDLVTVDGRDTLALYETLDGVRYCNYIYFFEGGVYECFTRADNSLDPRFGDRIMDVRDLSLSLSNRLLTVVVTDDAGRAHTLSLFLQATGREATA